MKRLFPMLALPCMVFAAQPPAGKPGADVTGVPPVRFSVPPSVDRDYLWTMIACGEEDERYVDSLYNAFLLAVGKKELPKGCFRVPQHFATLNGDYYIFERGYYISQNNLRGFSLSIPKNCVLVEEGTITPSCALAVSSRDGKQGQEIVVLKRKGS